MANPNDMSYAAVAGLAAQRPAVLPTQNMCPPHPPPNPDCLAYITASAPGTAGTSETAPVSATFPTSTPAQGTSSDTPATFDERNVTLYDGRTFAALLGGGEQGSAKRKPSATPSISSSNGSDQEAGAAAAVPANANGTPEVSTAETIGTSASNIAPRRASYTPATKVTMLKHATPELAELASYLKDKTQANILQYCLGIQDFPDAPALAKRIIVICFDTEGWTADSAKITEVGFNTFDIRDTRKVKPGPHGEKFLKHVYFYHIRVQPNAHLLNIKYCPGDPTANRFGQTRFLTRGETQGCLNDAFGWPLEPGKPELGYCPVILLGHALGGDLDKLQNTLGWSPQLLGNIVKIIDTQQLVRDVGWWDRRDQIGLPAIVSRCDFTYRNAHTASNDAAMTTIAAIKMVLPGAKCWESGDKSKPIQTVIDEAEARSKKHGWTWGSPKFCLRCGSRMHMQEDLDIDGLPCRAHVRCEHCIEAGRHGASFSHVTERCIQYALAHGNSALAKKTNEEKEAKKAKYMRRSSYPGSSVKSPAIGGSHRAFGIRIISEPPPQPYGPGGAFGPPLKQAYGMTSGPTDGKPALPFDPKASPFGKPSGLLTDKTNVPIARTTYGSLIGKPNPWFSKHMPNTGKLSGTSKLPAEPHHRKLPGIIEESADTDT
ncbi:hypothetical protein K458DRAFT_460583 [Lentithecium fluviatile CBS 122367]|uniref:Gfd2/YDR514C-like C-terminal domain-containing protein n=1 Tax=Lentithecium fluviatile CBS 122367 TaxID=1168545 RepID=A0A6G1INE8_9PLEO|nr:hypothetical protein K458DRAFT_460583 [Lentithecium fluviatile CBS 122367]